MRSIAGGFFLSLLIVLRATADAEMGISFATYQCGLVLRSEVDGSEVAAPVLGTTIEVRVTGVVARSRVTQIFANPTRQWLTGIYLFPLPDGVAVDTLRFVVDDRVIEGVVQETSEARQTFATAAAEGRKASLLEQVRPDLFTSSVANIGRATRWRWRSNCRWCATSAAASSPLRRRNPPRPRRRSAPLLPPDRPRARRHRRRPAHRAPRRLPHPRGRRARRSPIQGSRDRQRPADPEPRRHQPPRRRRRRTRARPRRHPR